MHYLRNYYSYSQIVKCNLLQDEVRKVAEDAAEVEVESVANAR